MAGEISEGKVKIETVARTVNPPTSKGVPPRALKRSNLVTGQLKIWHKIPFVCVAPSGLQSTRRCARYQLFARQQCIVRKKFRGYLTHPRLNCYSPKNTLEKNCGMHFVTDHLQNCPVRKNHKMSIASTHLPNIFPVNSSRNLPETPPVTRSTSFPL